MAHRTNNDPFKDASQFQPSTLADIIRAVKAAVGTSCQFNSTSTSKVLDETELAARWKMSRKSLQRWRFWGTGPRHLKLGRKVVYLVQDVEDFERQSLRKSTSEKAEASHA